MNLLLTEEIGEKMTVETIKPSTEVLLIPKPELSTGQASAIRNGAIAAVVNIASQVLHLPKNKLVVRDIRPKEDLDYTYASWNEKTGTSATTYETMISKTIADRRWIGIYGVMDNSPSIGVSKIRVTVGNSIKAIWVIENLYEETENGPRIGFAPSVTVLPPNTPCVVSRYVLDTSLAANIMLKGFVVEPYGKVLSP